MAYTKVDLLQVGSDLNASLRRATGMIVLLNTLVVCVILMLGVFVTPWVLPQAAILIGVTVYHCWALSRFGPIVVLGDGLDIGGRNVPYASITFVGQRWANWPTITIEYAYHGAKLEAFVATAGMRRNRIDLEAVAAELSTRAGLERQAEPVVTSQAPQTL